jgi:hypothetical protein
MKRIIKAILHPISGIRLFDWFHREALLCGRLGKIIAERTAGLAPGGPKYFDVVHRTIIEVLLTRREVPLTGSLRLYAGYALEQLWIPKGELNRIYRLRRLDNIEQTVRAAKLTKKTKPWAKAGKPKPEVFKKPVLAAAADNFGFSSAGMLKQFRGRARKTAQSYRRQYPPLPLWLMLLRSRKRRSRKPRP